MKKIITHSITICILSIMGLVWLFWVCKWQQRNPFWWKEFNPSPYQDDEGYKECDDNTDLWTCTSVKEKNTTIIVQLLGVFGLDTSTAKERDLKFIDYAMAILNMALGLVSFIALIMTIYTFYKMFFTENEAGIKKAKWNLFGIFIALVIIWLAWIIVSFIFRWYESNWKDNEEAIQKRTDIANIWEFW